MEDFFRLDIPFTLCIELEEWKAMVQNNFVYENDDIHVDLKEDKNVEVLVSYPDGTVKKIDMTEIN